MPVIVERQLGFVLVLFLLVAMATGPVSGQTPTPTPNGPRMTFFRPVFGDGCSFCCSFSCRLTPTPTPMLDAQGREIFVRGQSGFILVVEGGTGTGEEGSVRVSSSTGSRFLVPITHSSGRPTLQLLVNKKIGNGSTQRCDIAPPNVGGVPAIVPPDFRAGTDVTNALIDMACRFDVLNSQVPCTRDRFGELTFLGTGTLRQFCFLVPRTAAFPSHEDTIVSAQFRDSSGKIGPRREIVIRVGTPASPSSPSPTPTPTPTRTSTPSNNSIAGRLRYYSADRPVPAAAVRLSGPAQNTGMTINTGVYTFPSLVQGNWQVRPSKTGDIGGAISSLDAAFTLQSVVHRRDFTDMQKLACDVTGNGGLSSLDAARILQLRVGIISRLPVATTCASDWAFVPMPGSAPNQQLGSPQMATGSCTPGSINLQPLVGAAANQNFHGVLFGDCSGNWQPDGSAGSLVHAGGAEVRVGRPRQRGRRWVRVPILVDGPFSSLEAVLAYDSSQLQAPRVRRARAAKRALLVANERVRGRVSVALASSEPVEGVGGRALYVDFEVVRGRAADARITLLDASADDLPAR